MRRASGLVLLSLLLAGCSSTGSMFGSSSSGSGSSNQSGFGDRIRNLFGPGASESEKPLAGTAEPDYSDIECPVVTVREGASTYTVNGPGEPSAMTLRYEGTVGRVARECRVVAKMVQMKVGMEGRIILGPAGGPGKLDVPIRFAVVREGPVPQTILTKTYRKEVVIEPNANSVSFVEVDDQISFPLPANGKDFENYVVYVGFDPEALKPTARKPAARKSGPRKPAKPRPAAPKPLTQ
jgi:hypothetical protein